ASLHCFNPSGLENPRLAMLRAFLWSNRLGGKQPWTCPFPGLERCPAPRADSLRVSLLLRLDTTPRAAEECSRSRGWDPEGPMGLLSKVPLVLALLVGAIAAQAVDGVLEINQACATSSHGPSI